MSRFHKALTIYLATFLSAGAVAWVSLGTWEQIRCSQFQPELQPIPSGAVPADILGEMIDQPTLAYAAYSSVVPLPNGQYADPHDDPEWHHTRSETAKAKCCCEVNGCRADPKGNAIHHGIAANACVKGGHYELAVGPGPGQKFYRLCAKHHAEIGHGIGNGGNWTRFNLDIEADVLAGRWNSRGKSAWTFRDDADLVAWVKGRVERDSR